MSRCRKKNIKKKVEKSQLDVTKYMNEDKCVKENCGEIVSDKELEKGIKSFLGKNLKNFGTISGIITSISAVIVIFINATYQQSCEDFYNIPGEYFKTNINYKITYIFWILVLILGCIFPKILLTNEKKNKDKVSSSTLILCILIPFVYGITMGAVELHYVLGISRMKEGLYDSVKPYEDFLFVILTVVSWSWLYGMTFYDKVKAVNKASVRTIIENIILIFFALNFVIVGFGMITEFASGVEDKTAYEIVSFDGDKYIVLSEVNGNNLVVRYELDEDGNYTLFTHEYFFFEKTKGTCTYIDMNRAPHISLE